MITRIRPIGFDEFKKQILGEKDGTPRTPGWVAEITGVPARDITALAREWAAKRTMLGCGAMYGVGGACRAAYATEWPRLMVFLIAMQGLGKPGVNVWGGASMGPPIDFSFQFQAKYLKKVALLYLEDGRAVTMTFMSLVVRLVPVVLSF